MRKTLSAAAFMLGAALAPAAGAQTQAAVVYKNAKIYTLDGKSSVASAVAIAGERFLAVGDEAAVQPFIGAGTQVVDLAGAAVIPGLNDTHAHFLSAGVEASQIPMRGAKNVAEALERIKTAAAAKKPGEWLLGASWHPPSQLAEHRYLTRAEIDSVAPNNPVYLQTVGHVAMANSAALKIAGIDRNTPNPEGGTIQKDQAGEPDGILFERAIEMVEKKAPPVTMAELEGQYLAAMKNANSLGLTSVLDPGAPIANIRALQRITQAGKSTLRLGVMYAPSPTVPPEQWAQEVNTLVASGFGNEWLRLNAIGEMAIDGGMTLRTAYMRAGYPDDAKYHGMTTMTKERLNAVVAVANANDWRLAIHCVGDAGCDWVLDAYEAANASKSIAGRRFALIHGSLLQRDQLERAKRLGVILEQQNTFMWEKAAAVERYLTRKVADRAVPTKMSIDILGINNVSSGTDYPVNIMNPFLSLYIAVTRKDPTGRVYGAQYAIPRETALRLYTVSGAYTSFEENEKGPIEVGKLADMVVLDRDYMTVPVEQIKDIKPLKTIVGGRIVYQQ